MAPNHTLSLCEPRANQCIPSLTRLIPTANFRLCVTELASDMLRSVGLSSHFHATKVLDISRFSGGRRESDTGHAPHTPLLRSSTRIDSSEAQVEALPLGCTSPFAGLGGWSRAGARTPLL